MHLMVWLQGSEGESPPASLWSSTQDQETLIQEISNFGSSMIHGSIEKASCSHHDVVDPKCVECGRIQRLVTTYQAHSHKQSCFKKKKFMRIASNEGHGRYDGVYSEEEIVIPRCRYSFPKCPMDETTFITAFPKDTPKEIVKSAKEDYGKVRRFLLRLTNRRHYQESAQWQHFLEMSFNEFLFAVGMFEDEDKTFPENDEKKIKKARDRYLTALRSEVKSTGYIALARTGKDVFINNFNKALIDLHPANIDIQFICDEYAVAEYISGINQSTSCLKTNLILFIFRLLH